MATQAMAAQTWFDGPRRRSGLGNAEDVAERNQLLLQRSSGRGAARRQRSSSSSI